MSVFSIVIPVYNEEKVIREVLRDHVAVLAQMGEAMADWEIICLDDGSSDQSFLILQEEARANPRIVVLKNEHNKGIAETFRLLFQNAKGTYVYATGGDGQWPAENCQRLWERLRATSADLVVGVRENRNEVYGLWRRILSYGFNLVPQIFFHVRTADANGIKLGRREIFQLPLDSRSFFGEVERIIKARDRGFKVDFAPVLFLPRTAGKARGGQWRNIWATVKDLIKYIFRKRSSG